MDNTTTVKGQDQYFTPTDFLVDMGNMWHGVFMADADAVKWDGAPEEVVHSLYSDRHDVHSYCEIRIQTRTRLMYHGGRFGGVWGRRCRVRFFNTLAHDAEDRGWGEWSDAVIYHKDQSVDWAPSDLNPNA